MINEFPDYGADQAADKWIPVVRIGQHLSSQLYAGAMALTFLAVAVLPFSGFPMTIWLALIAVPSTYAVPLRLLENPETTSQIIPAQANILLTFLLFALSAGIRFLISPLLG